MSKNGFFHPVPNAEDVYVHEDMRAEIGSDVINAAVTGSHYDAEQRIVAHCQHNGKTYTVENRHDYGFYWLLVG